MPDGSDFLRGADRRLTAARGDIAAAHLEGAVDSQRFVAATPMQVKAAIIPLRPSPEATAGIDTVLLYGEGFDAYDSADGWVWGQAVRDGYVGYVPEAAVSSDIFTPTHTIAVPTTHLYPKNSLKTEPIAALWMSSLVEATKIHPANTEGVAFAEVNGVFLPAKHLAPLDDHAPDFVTIAETFLHAPYVWGGKTAAGIDCSGLVQIALARMGREVPRDSDMQSTSIGTEISLDGPFQRGDLLFWPGHVGIMTNADTLLHATAFSMRVMLEPLDETRKRIETKIGLPLISVRRL